VQLSLRCFPHVCPGQSPSALYIHFPTFYWSRWLENVGPHHPVYLCVLNVCVCVFLQVFGMLLGDTLLLDTLEDASSYRQEVCLSVCLSVSVAVIAFVYSGILCHVLCRCRQHYWTSIWHVWMQCVLADVGSDHYACPDPDPVFSQRCGNFDF